MSPTEEWIDDCAGTKGQLVGFPYKFPFYFDRDDIRYSILRTSRDETWTSAISKTGRYGVSGD